MKRASVESSVWPQGKDSYHRARQRPLQAIVNDENVFPNACTLSRKSWYVKYSRRIHGSRIKQQFGSEAPRRNPTRCILFFALTVAFFMRMHITSFFVPNGRLRENVRHEYSHFAEREYRPGRFVTPVATSIAYVRTHDQHPRGSIPHCRRVTLDVYTPVCVLLLLKKKAIFTIWVPLSDEIFQ